MVPVFRAHQHNVDVARELAVLKRVIQNCHVCVRCCSYYSGVTILADQHWYISIQMPMYLGFIVAIAAHDYRGVCTAIP
jgi:hypothetical protein